MNTSMEAETSPHTNNNMVADPVLEIVSLQEQIQYKIQLLLHVNSILLARLYSLQNKQQQQSNGSISDTVEQPAFLAELNSQYLKRVHANLQCISFLHQGKYGSRPNIITPPDVGLGNNNGKQQDALNKLYLLMSRMFELWP
ncbi:Snf11p SCDLUD_001624 [Saccharomycodes ludwigii]|uniref:Snf11p n=1 Tax=Saccharomycodes ludwigii TaxID=36035 RepID=UPI001E824379|nr:hypothetical protein SCDLUD_001624 [Saccharomycodes ludwigii]KAH3901841.1 hypothetical protein SCDLUD_001624 [Saccharomycodes ludwigii]